MVCVYLCVFCEHKQARAVTRDDVNDDNDDTTTTHPSQTCKLHAHNTSRKTTTPPHVGRSHSAGRVRARIFICEEKTLRSTTTDTKRHKFMRACRKQNAPQYAARCIASRKEIARDEGETLLFMGVLCMLSSSSLCVSGLNVIFLDGTRSRCSERYAELYPNIL